VLDSIKSIYLKDYKKPKFEIKRCDLHFELFEDFTIVTNMMELNKLDADASDIRLDAMDLELIEIYLNNLKLNDTR